MKKWLLLLIFFAPLLWAEGQTISLKGQVLHKADRSPVEGATVRSGRMATTTDAAGNFSLRVAKDQTLTISYVGLTTVHRKVGNAPTVTIEMEPSNDSLGQVVVTGYQTQKKADLTGAVSVVDVKEVQDIPTGNPLKALQGRIPGVYIQTDGYPMGGAVVQIRGIGTLGNNDPLYVIDGVPTRQPLGLYNAADIESMQVLKDASSATIYGSRAANGVIIITTKRAKKNTNRIDVGSRVSLQRFVSPTQVLNTQERGRAYWQAAVNDHSDPNSNQIYQYDWNNDYTNPVLNKVILPEFIDAAKTMHPADTRWFDQIAQPSLIADNTLSVAHGSENGGTLFSLGYYTNKGIVKQTFQDRITARINSDYSYFKGRLRVGENFTASFVKGSTISPGDVLFAALVSQPIVPVHTVDGGWGGPAPGMTDRQNPVRLINDNQQNKVYVLSPFGNVYAELEIIPKLRLRSSIGVEGNVQYSRTIRKSYVSGFLSDPSNQAVTYENNNYTATFQNTLTYDLEKGKHHLNLLLGAEQVNSVYQNFSASRQGYALETIDYAYLDAGSTNKDNGGSGGGFALISYFAKANYDYAGKYLASVTVRRDGSSRFGPNNRYGNFPAFSLGWRLSEEAFIRDHVPVINDLKIRYGWGKAGNQEIANNAIYTIYTANYGTDPTWNYDAGTAYDINGAGSGQLPSGFASTQTGNPSLKWESSVQSNIGIDFTLLGNHISGSVDYFTKNASDILILPPPIAVLGEGGYEYRNGASMDNKGFEALLSYDGKIGRELRFGVSANIATYRNRVVYLPSSVLTAYPGNGRDKTILNHSINSYFGYVADGLFTTQKELDGSATQVGKGLGRIRYKDLNGDGVIDVNDQDYIGSSDPKFTYGVNLTASWHNLDFACFFQGVSGVMVNNTNKVYTDFSSLWPGVNWGKRTLQAWTPSNPKSTIPALTLLDANNEGRFSTYFIEPGSYLKLRNLELGYTFKQASNRWKMKQFRVFIMGNNIGTIKNRRYTGPDPEIPNSGYPMPAIYTVGLNASL